MTEGERPLVSIIIPTYNEESDIKNTIDSLLSLTYENKEIIVVDDSNDLTPKIVGDYQNPNVKLYHREKNIDGRCGARNYGILSSNGEILIILNADVILPKDFIEKILPHYEAGADYVLVESIVHNMESLFPRYIEAEYHQIYDGHDWIEWTEGFSCRKKAALDVGMFPVSEIPLVAGEDGHFGQQLNKNGFKKVIDRTIKVYPVFPEDFWGYWKCRQEKRSVLPTYFLYNKPFYQLIFKETIYTLYSMIFVLTILPAFLWAYKLQRFSPKGIIDILPFFYCAVIERLATITGGWDSIVRLIKYFFKRNHNRKNDRVENCV